MIILSMALTIVVHIIQVRREGRGDMKGRPGGKETGRNLQEATPTEAQIESSNVARSCGRTCAAFEPSLTTHRERGATHNTLRTTAGIVKHVKSCD